MYHFRMLFGSISKSMKSNSFIKKSERVMSSLEKDDGAVKYFGLTFKASAILITNFYFGTRVPDSYCVIRTSGDLCGNSMDSSNSFCVIARIILVCLIFHL